MSVKGILRNKIYMFLVVLLFFNIFYIKDTHAAWSKATYYRGSFLMWTRDNVDFEYSGGKVKYSGGYQQSGWIFPNISRNKGIVRYSTSNYEHKYRAVNTIGAGIPTPWGDVKVYENKFVHRLNVRGNGSWNAYSD